MTLNAYYRFRDDVAASLRRELVGPRADELLDGDDQLTEAPLTRFLAGVLYPQSSEPVAPERDGEIAEPLAGGDGADSERPEPVVSMANVRYPSSLGMTFAVDPSCKALTVRVSAAMYEEVPNSDVDAEGGKRRRRHRSVTQARELWNRVPVNAPTFEIPTDKPTRRGRCALADGLEAYWIVRPVRDGSISITAGLVNVLTLPEGEYKRDGFSFFQTGMEVTGVDIEAPFVARHPDAVAADDLDQRAYRLLYRHAVEFATGHGTSVAWDANPSDHSRAVALRIEHAPVFEVLAADSNPKIESPWFGMLKLGESEPDAVIAGLSAFCDAYDAWIDLQDAKIAFLPSEALQETARSHLATARNVVERMRTGVGSLGDADVFRAFGLANRAMAEQRARSDREEVIGEDDQLNLAEHSWRPFQLGFLLVALAGISDPQSSDRKIVDLLWFPTGGGKTEAYLGLIAFTIFLRRLRSQSGGGAGVTVLMRYTLRLLTIQQFERAALLMCVCEQLRLEDETELGKRKIEIGLWVGRGGSPNTISEARRALNDLRAGKTLEEKNPVQLQICPWCRTPLDYRNYWVRDKAPTRLVVSCGNDACAFRTGLPVLVVDEDIYTSRPALIVATADKYASLPWREQATELFNIGSTDAPPELIIQDELHLISGPLGTLTGLYETAVDLLCHSADGVMPKVIASTATIRRASQQVTGLFGREVSQFPPPGIDARDSWFAVERPREERGSRLYIGLVAPASSQTTLLVRVYSVLLQRASEIEADDAVRDQYWTLLGYFNSLRVLGGARMQVHADVPEYMKVIASRSGHDARPIDQVIELTSREASSRIPTHLREMAKPYGTRGVLDAILATNMISVGVDVSRLGVMAVMGQPQSASEYIQATSRVGRRYPGLVAVIFNAARSRDRSHYESFTSFHASLYKQVDASSVTPFSPRARDRGLHAVVVALARLTVPELRPNDGARNVAALEANLPGISDLVMERVMTVSAKDAAETRAHLDAICEAWIARARRDSDLCYSNPKNSSASLLVDATDGFESSPMEGSFATLWSLRDVDSESQLFFLRG